MFEFNGFSSVEDAMDISKQIDAGFGMQILARFEKFPVFMGCTSAPRDMDKHSDMFWLANPATGETSVLPVLDMSLIYLENHNEVVGETWIKHHELFGEFVAKHAKGDFVYEIGGAHGMASLAARKQTKDLQWLIHDINPIPVQGYVGEIILGEFNSQTSIQSGKFQTIIHSHTLEHVHDQIEFLRAINKNIEIGARHIISWPNMDEMLSKRNLSFLNFEHTKFLPLERVLVMLENSGFSIVDISYFGDHSIFIATEKVSDGESLEIKSRVRLAEFDSYCQSLLDQVKSLNAQINHFEGQIHLFGAHIFTQMLIAAGLDTSKIHTILDNADHKSGKRLYGTDLEVQKPSLIESNESNSDPVLIVAVVGEYFVEIKSQLQVINPNVIVINQ
jgi:hypothetical protein